MTNYHFIFEVAGEPKLKLLFYKFEITFSVVCLQLLSGSRGQIY